MRKVDLQENNSDARLNGALRSLADASAAGPPPEIGEALISAFRRHHVRRRALRRTAWAGTICALLLTVWVWLAARHPMSPTTARKPEPAVVSPPTPTPAVAVAAGAHPGPRNRTIRPAAAVKGATKVQDDDFVILSAYGQPVRGEELRIIRLEVTGTALRMVGAPVMEQKENRSVLADFVVGQDGTPYAVRLVSATPAQ